MQNICILQRFVVEVLSLEFGAYCIIFNETSDLKRFVGNMFGSAYSYCFFMHHGHILHQYQCSLQWRHNEHDGVSFVCSAVCSVTDQRKKNKAPRNWFLWGESQVKNATVDTQAKLW